MRGTLGLISIFLLSVGLSSCAVGSIGLVGGGAGGCVISVVPLEPASGAMKVTAQATDSFVALDIDFDESEEGLSITLSDLKENSWSVTMSTDTKLRLKYEVGTEKVMLQKWSGLAYTNEWASQKGSATLEGDGSGWNWSKVKDSQDKVVFVKDSKAYGFLVSGDIYRRSE